MSDSIEYGKCAEYRTGISGWVCTKCHRYWGDSEHMASYCCCTFRICDCGNSTSDKWHITCDSCRRQAEDAKHIARLEAAELVEWDGEMILCEEIGYRDGYFESPDDVIEYCEDEGVDIPEFGFVCCSREVKLDLGCILEAAEESIEWSSEWDEPCYEGLPELGAAIAKFNEANKGIRSWWADYKRKVRIR